MSLSFGRPYLAIPGPSVVPDRVLNAMHTASTNIYEGQLLDMVDTLYPDLRAMARTTGDVAIYIGNGHAAWEASLSNVFSRGDNVLVLATGAFGHGWGETATDLGINVEMLDFGRQSAFDFDQIDAALRADKSHKIKAILATHTDTATSIRNDIEALRKCIDASDHPALLMVDCIASFGCDRFEMDLWGVDVMIAASQKGLMMAPGLCFVWFSEKAAASHANANLKTPYWNWEARAHAPELFRQFCGTAPVQHLYGLREALDMLLHEEGLEAVWARHAILAKAVWAALDEWGKTGSIKMNVAETGQRSNAVTSVQIDAPDGTRLRRWVQDNAGVTLGIGLGMATDDDPNSDGYFRIAHMGHVNAHMTLGVLGVIQSALTALDIAHGKGALEAASDVIASI
ncbi:MAG: alanine-glyoxylate transaminase/serine-glyoxylate transaminase/serine-pyruvate transaminase [Paracoccaceae bacterium]|jgi:alanine-glyoxylate transaminase/serine-glyoxylate transaminase/serine-pyruvate transaminase